MIFLNEFIIIISFKGQMGKQKKNKDKKDKKKKDKDRQRDKDRKDKKKKQKKRSYSSSSSSSDSSSSSSQSRQKGKKKDNKNKRKQQKQKKTEVKPTNNPYDFQKSVIKPVQGFPVGLPAPGFSIPLLHAAPPPPSTNPASTIQKPKMKQIHIFKLLPKISYGSILFAKTLYSTQLIQPKVYDKILKQMIGKVQKTVKQQNHKKGISIINKCMIQMQRLTAIQEQTKRNQEINGQEQFIKHDNMNDSKENRFTNLKKIYENYFQQQ